MDACATVPASLNGSHIENTGCACPSVDRDTGLKARIASAVAEELLRRLKFMLVPLLEEVLAASQNLPALQHAPPPSTSSRMSSPGSVRKQPVSSGHASTQAKVADRPSFHSEMCAVGESKWSALPKGNLAKLSGSEPAMRTKFPTTGDLPDVPTDRETLATSVNRFGGIAEKMALFDASWPGSCLNVHAVQGRVREQVEAQQNRALSLPNIVSGLEQNHGCSSSSGLVPVQPSVPRCAAGASQPNVVLRARNLAPIEPITEKTEDSGNTGNWDKACSEDAPPQVMDRRSPASFVTDFSQ